MFSLRQLNRSFRSAFRGVGVVFREEQSFRIQVIVAAAVFVLMGYFRVRRWEGVVLALLVMLVLTLELLNSIFERIIDMLKPRFHSYAGNAKDILAAAVLIASFGSFVVGIIIFWPYFLEK